MQKKDGKCKDIGSVKFSHDSQVVKEINSEIVSGALWQCEPFAFASEDLLSKFSPSSLEYCLPFEQ